MKNLYILLGGDGYFGRNFTAYLCDNLECPFNQNIITIDKHSKNEGMNQKDYIEYDLRNEININLKNRNDFNEIIIINFAAISFVDDSISNPDETIDNNLKCCINGYKLYKSMNASKYIYISTDEVRVNKNYDELSPYVVSKMLCEEYLIEKSKGNKNIKIIRPVNLMDVVNDKMPELQQQNRCLLNIIANASENDIIHIHGTGEQKRMFMRMDAACKTLYDICISKVNRMFNPDRLLLFDIVDYPSLRTKNLKIKDIVIYLSEKLNLKYNYIEDPRGKYQDMTYSKHYIYPGNLNGLDLIYKSVLRMKYLNNIENEKNIETETYNKSQ